MVIVDWAWLVTTVVEIDCPDEVQVAALVLLKDSHVCQPHRLDDGWLLCRRKIPEKSLDSAASRPWWAHLSWCCACRLSDQHTCSQASAHGHLDRQWRTLTKLSPAMCQEWTYHYSSCMMGIGRIWPQLCLLLRNLRKLLLSSALAVLAWTAKSIGLVLHACYPVCEMQGQILCMMHHMNHCSSSRTDLLISKFVLTCIPLLFSAATS